GSGCEAGSRRQPDQADDDLLDRGRGVHRIPPLREADGRDAAHGAGRGRLQRQDQAPPRPPAAGGRRAAGRQLLGRPHRVPPPQHQARLQARGPHQDVRRGSSPSPANRHALWHSVVYDSCGSPFSFTRICVCYRVFLSHKEFLWLFALQTINLAAICTPADYNTRPLDTIYSNFIDALPVVRYCSENNKRLIHFSTCEVYGKTLGSYLPKDHPLRQESEFYVLKEDASPCIFGSVEKQRWSYACAKQLIERLIYAEGAENGLEFTIVRPFNWIGPRMDFIPGIDGPSEGVPRVLACFSNNLLRREPLKLVDGGQSQRTFVYIKDAIEAVLLMIENPARANGQIFNVGNPNNEVTIKQLAEIMVQVYSRVSGEPPLEAATIDVSSKQFYGEGYDDSDKRIPDMTIINKQLGWNPKTSLRDLLDSTLTYQHRTYAEAVRMAMVKPVASS
ncbi:unnamed protein product, partial [Musa textilis]